VLTDTQRQALLSRGDAFLIAGDVMSARLFYQRGADAGDSMAALRLGETFDAAFLQRAGLSRVANDPKKAAVWYRRARDLGNAEADILLKVLQAN
jgi:TPR repeat protein